MTKALYLVLLAVVLVGQGYVTLAADIEDCTDNDELGEFVQADILGCTDDDIKCPLYRGHNASISLKFKTKKEIKSVSHVVHGIVGIPVPFPLANPSACQNAGLQCPLAEGEHTYHYSLFVKTIYPKLSVKVKWELFNEDKKQIVCVNIPAILKDPK